MLIDKLRPPYPAPKKSMKLEAKYFIIISAGIIDRRELLQISSFYWVRQGATEKEINENISRIGLTFSRNEAPDNLANFTCRDDLQIHDKSGILASTTLHG